MSAFTTGPFNIVRNPNGENYFLMPTAGRITLAVATIWIRGYGQEIAQANAFLLAQAYRMPDLAKRIVAVHSREDLEALKAEARLLLEGLETPEVIG